MGALPSVMGLPARSVAVSMGVTVPSPWLATYAVVPSGVMATARGELPTPMVVPGVAGKTMGVTVLSPWLATYAVEPSGVMAMAAGALPTAMGLPAVFVVVSMGVTVSSPLSVT